LHHALIAAGFADLEPAAVQDPHNKEFSVTKPTANNASEPGQTILALR
jgi:hypothetical protein